MMSLRTSIRSLTLWKSSCRKVDGLPETPATHPLSRHVLNLIQVHQPDDLHLRQLLPVLPLQERRHDLLALLLYRYVKVRTVRYAAPIRSLLVDHGRLEQVAVLLNEEAFESGTVRRTVLGYRRVHQIQKPPQSLGTFLIGLISKFCSVSRSILHAYLRPAPRFAHS